MDDTTKAVNGATIWVVDDEPERFFRPPYVGHRGWIGVRLDRDTDWGEIEAIVIEAYRHVAPKTLVRELDEVPADRSGEADEA